MYDEYIVPHAPLILILLNVTLAYNSTKPEFHLVIYHVAAALGPKADIAEV
jgi:hypothetical protein